MENFNNKTKKVGDDLKKTIEKDDIIDVATRLFSIYGYESLKKELNKIKKMRFIFTDPAFIKEEQEDKERRQFKINSDLSKASIGGSVFEITLKNQLKSKAIAKECKEWIKKKVEFKSNKKSKYIENIFNIHNKDKKITYTPIKEFSSAGFGYQNDNTILGIINKFANDDTAEIYLKMFDDLWDNPEFLKDVTNDVLDYIANLYKENSPELIYNLILYNIFNEFLEDVSEHELANEKTGFKKSTIWNMLYDFQKDAALGIINKLEKHNGCILADSVGLGKTFTALAVIKYYQMRNRSILVLCPKKLANNWLTFRENYKDNPLIRDRFNYDVLHHTDLLRIKGYSNGIDLSKINWSNYDLLVIDESHNFRNNNNKTNKMTRYKKLLEHVIKEGVKTKVLMLSATPVNNGFNDLKNQLALAYEGETNKIHSKLGMNKSIDVVLRRAQSIFNEWMKSSDRSPSTLLSKLSEDFDFFKLLDEVTIARSRKHIMMYYDINKLGNFPKRLKPINIQSEITSLNKFIGIKELYERLGKFKLATYSPFEYILPNKRLDYDKLYDTQVDEKVKFKQIDREKSLKILIRINFLKRLESSIDSFRITLGKFVKNIEEKLDLIDRFRNGEENSEIETNKIIEDNGSEEIDMDLDLEELEEENNENQNNDDVSSGKKIKIKLIHMDYEKWEKDLLEDLRLANSILENIKSITPEYDSKLKNLKELIDEKINNPINDNNKKLLIFTAFADTAEYLYKNLSSYLKSTYNIEVAKITGSNKNKTTLNISKEFNNILKYFSPRSKSFDENLKKEIDVLIATDCISEGQNLQDCDMVVNYDIHWNPVRIIQRFGRIDRIGSKNKYIQLINFWPQLSLDDYIKLRARVESKMQIVDMTATGEDNVLTNTSSDLSFRKKQLEKLKEEVVDLEDMDTGVSITDLGLNDFRMDLINYIKNHKLDNLPNGMHSVCKKDPSKKIEEGVIFVLKNINKGINIDRTNQLHPFYIVYIKQNGEVLHTHLNAKKSLDILRSISKGKDKPIREIYEIFNEETNDGRNMEKYSELLNKSIKSILNVKEEKDIDSLFSEGGTTVLLNNIKGLEDFELIAFMVIK